MTYSLDIINLCFFNIRDGKSKKYVSNILNISINTNNSWIVKYNHNFINKIRFTEETIEEYKKNN